MVEIYAEVHSAVNLGRDSSRSTISRISYGSRPRVVLEQMAWGIP
jgi:hypothetical protein